MYSSVSKCWCCDVNLTTIFAIYYLIIFVLIKMVGWRNQNVQNKSLYVHLHLISLLEAITYLTTSFVCQKYLSLPSTLLLWWPVFTAVFFSVSAGALCSSIWVKQYNYNQITCWIGWHYTCGSTFIWWHLSHVKYLKKSDGLVNWSSLLPEYMYGTTSNYIWVNEVCLRLCPYICHYVCVCVYRTRQRINLNNVPFYN